MEQQKKMINELQNENYKLKKQNRQFKELYGKSLRENMEMKKKL